MTDKDSELDKLFNNKTDAELQKQKFYPVIPPQLRANRSVLLFSVDNHIFQNSEEEIKQEIIKSNEWTGTSISVFKYPKGNTLKITFAETAQARKSQEAGLLLFSMKIIKFTIKQDVFYNIITCLKCYALETHYTSQYPKDKSFKISSECSQIGHTWRECDKAAKCCINCNGDYLTLAMKCPKKKEIINNKKKKRKTRNPEYI